MYKLVDWSHPMNKKINLLNSKMIVFTSKRDHQWRLIDRKNALQPIDNNNHSVNEHVFGQSVGPARNIDLLKNKERTKSKHKPKSK